jgi:hypothetical protein
MKYLCLGYYEPKAFDALSAEQQNAIAAECRPHDERLYATGRVVAVASLEHRRAVSIRPGRKTGPSVTDGPYAEAKEVVGSFFIVEADDLDEAVRLASLHPAAQWGEHLGFGIEVRPIDYWVFNG